MLYLLQHDVGPIMNSLYMFITKNGFFTFIIQGKPGVFTLVVTNMGHQNKQDKTVVILYLFDN